MVLRKIPGPGHGGSVLDLGQKNAFDDQWVTCPSVLKTDGEYKMWYSSFYDSKQGKGGIGIAVSKDGIHWTRSNNSEPVLKVGDKGNFDDGQVMGPCVLFDGKIYRMWYTGMAREWHSSGFGHYRIGLATSRDGIQWHRENGGRPVIDANFVPPYDEVQAATPSVLKTANGYRMWFAAWSPEKSHTICVAQSTDGIRWKPENNGQPVRGLAFQEVYAPEIVLQDERYLLLFSALRTEKSCYAAISADGIEWKMLQPAPVIPMGKPSAFDDAIINHPCILQENDALKIWYTGYTRLKKPFRALNLRIGLAEASLN